MEALLHYAWRHRLFTPSLLVTTEGLGVDVLSTGVPNRDAGPDFSNAQLRIDGTLWAGNVEMHLKASQWHAHGHDHDPAYNSVILHVVCVADVDAVTADGRTLPTLVLPIPDALKQGYEQLLRTADYPRCHSIIASLPTFMVHSWMSTLLVERMQQRSDLVRQRAEVAAGDWERAFFITLARSFGFGKNGDAFEQWARQLPYAALAHHRDNLEQVEALFLGSAGLLPPDRESLRREYAYLCHKYSLTTTMQASVWRYMRMRPGYFPHTKIQQLAAIYSDYRATLSGMVELAMQGDASEVVRKITSQLRLSSATAQLVIINAVVPVLWAYGDHTHRSELQQRATALLEQLPAEQNYIMRQWHDCGLSVATAADSQALIHLKRTRCDTHDCLHCRFGYEYLKRIKDKG